MRELLFYAIDSKSLEDQEAPELEGLIQRLSESEHEERRTERRFVYAMPASATLLDADLQPLASLDMLTRDLSTQGAALIHTKPLWENAQFVEIQFEPPGSMAFGMFAEIIWQRSYGGFHLTGVRFKSPLPDLLDRVKRSISREDR